ncbi:hypothetical protein RvY_05323 [Ramazzottius varieornatus]|uniref:Uncharacterized protein n=1 Tax=Ramazzottius varieornatus TaxID=947166 RepID=A0A1D1UXQ6_RAMVA|nr:hypothetical protein RvY_05323 [Ramazzottius varieornatus]
MGISSGPMLLRNLGQLHLYKYNFREIRHGHSACYGPGGLSAAANEQRSSQLFGRILAWLYLD